MIKHKLQATIAVLSIVFAGLIVAANQPSDPIVMLKSVSTNVLRALKNNKSNNVYGVIDQYILPHVDFTEMSIWVAGRNAWAKSAPNSQQEFVREFKILVVRTYATALNSYSNEVVEFPPQHVDLNKSRVQISSRIKRANKDTISVNYRLVKHGDEWLVYDIIIEGVSILQGFQAQFSQEIRQKGLDKVIAQIKEHNRKVDVTA